MKICFWLMTFFVVNSLLAAEVFKSQVTPSFELALSWVKKSPLPPPHFAHIISLATECGERAIKISTYDKSFALAFLLTLENLEPKWKGIFDEGIKRKILPIHNIENTVRLINKNEHRWMVSKKEALEVASQSLRTSDFDDGEWRPTPPYHAPPVLPNWHELLRFDGASFDIVTKHLTPNHILSPAYYAELDEVLILGNKFNYDSRLDKISKFWAAGAGTVTPPGMWLQAALKALPLSTYSDVEKISIIRGLTTSLSYAGITCWKIKYKFKTWRPITAIRESGLELNWTPRLDTPPFPSYVSGHSTFSAAAATFLNAYGINFLTFDDGKGQTKSFTKAWSAAVEAGKSRIYGGIHFETDNKDGLELGKSVACQTLRMMNRNCL